MVTSSSNDNLAAWTDPAHTALLIVDMQVDFCLAGGRTGAGGDRPVGG